MAGPNTGAKLFASTAPGVRSDVTASAPALSPGAALFHGTGPQAQATTVVVASPKKSGGGLFSRIVGGVKSGLDKTEHLGESIGTGLYAQGAAEVSALKQTAEHPFISPAKFAETYAHPLRVVPGTSNTPQNIAFGKALRSSIDQTAEHPLRSPVNTALNLFAVASAGAGAVARAGYAATALRAASDAADAGEASSLRAAAAKAVVSPVHKPPTSSRFLKVPKLVAPEVGPARLTHEAVQLPASGGNLARLAQKGHDVVVQRALDKNVTAAKPSVLARYGAHRVAGSIGEGTRITSNLRAVPEQQLARAGLRGPVKAILRKSAFDQGVTQKQGQLAIFLRSANVTGDEAARYWRAQAARGVNPAETGKLADLAQQIHDAGLLHVQGDNVQVAADRFPKLAQADTLTSAAQQTRADIIREHGLMTDAELQNRLDLVGRTMATSSRDLVRLPSGGTGIREPGVTSIYDLQKAADQSRTVLRGEQKKLTTLEARLAKPSPSGRVRARPQLQAKVKTQRASVVEWQQQVAADERRLNTEGPKIITAGARPGQGYVPLKTSVRRMPQNPIAQMRSVVTGKPQGFLGAKRATGAGVATGHIPDDTTAGVARALHEALRYQNTVDYRGRVAQFGSDVRRTGQDVLVLDPNAARAGEIPENIDVLLGRKTSQLNTISEAEHQGLANAMRARLEESIPGLQDNFARDREAALGTHAPAGYKWVPQQMIPAELTRAATPRSNLAKVGDQINAAVTSATVYLKVGHLPTRGFTNAATNIVQGSATPRQIGKTVSLVNQLSETEKRELAAVTGTHGYAALPHAGTSKISVVAGKGANWWAKHIDAPFRINAIMYELRQIGIDTPEGVRQALAQLKDPTRGGMSAEKISQLDAAVRRANRSAIMYDGLSDVEKRYLTRYFWFYPWTKAAVRFAGHTATEHPFKTAAGAAVANVGQQYQQNALGTVPTFEYGLTPITGGQSPLTMNVSSFTPFSTVGQVAGVARAPLSIDTGLPSQLNPAYSGLVALLQGKGVRAAAGQAVQPTPESQAVTAFRHPPGPTRMFGATNVGVGGSSREKAALSALARALGGTAVPRPTRKSALASAYARQHAKKRTITVYSR